jgi:hypothetical protein
VPHFSLSRLPRVDHRLPWIVRARTEGHRLPLLALIPQWRQDSPNNRPPTRATAISAMGHNPPAALQKGRRKLAPRLICNPFPCAPGRDRLCSADRDRLSKPTHSRNGLGGTDEAVTPSTSASSRRSWGRPDDTFGLAGVVNEISGAHIAYLNAGGLGILVGDGQLPHPGPEQIIETYYSFPIGSWQATVDYQFIANPGYNRDRGPISVVAMRLHAQF